VRTPPLLAATACASATLRGSEAEGEEKREDENQTLDEVLGVIGRVQHGEAIEQDADEHGANRRSEDIGLFAPSTA